ncbi:hypothetical protein TUBRATIS_23870 [Tubulinosema ratisbonensis]|uniref:Uncharacterized protein n=1 Tax=Tubulinosema ratisbonensis TaxID=291195 RepID=A0A437AJ95_9MICR|nr:hypothetical protein TUBRATIS_23870 [Tubulinosema ratisbonensis]
MFFHLLTYVFATKLEFTFINVLKNFNVETTPKSKVDKIIKISDRFLFHVDKPDESDSSKELMSKLGDKKEVVLKSFKNIFDIATKMVEGEINNEEFSKKCDVELANLEKEFVNDEEGLVTLVSVFNHAYENKINPSKSEKDE